MCISHNIASSFHCHMCWLEFKMPLPPAKKQKTLACLRGILRFTHLLKSNWKLSSSHSISILTNISTQFLLQSVYVCVCVCACVCSTFCCFNIFFIILYINCFGRTVLYMCIEYHIKVNMYHVSTQGVDERMINVHYYYYYYSQKGLTAV